MHLELFSIFLNNFASQSQCISIKTSLDILHKKLPLVLTMTQDTTDVASVKVFCGGWYSHPGEVGGVQSPWFVLELQCYTLSSHSLLRMEWTPSASPGKVNVPRRQPLQLVLKHSSSSECQRSALLKNIHWLPCGLPDRIMPGPGRKIKAKKETRIMN